MQKEVRKNITYKYCPRFGQIAFEMGFVTEEQLMEAFRCQIEPELSGQGHDLLGHILLDKGWMTCEQIEQVMNALLKRMREEAVDHPLNTHSGIS